MHILDLGSLGYQVGAAGIIAFTLAFLVSVRWWTDWLGKVLAGVLFSMSSVLVIVVLRQIYPERTGGLLIARAIVFWVFGFAVWTSLGTFVWAQFFAPRIKKNRRSKVPDHTKGTKYEETRLADRGDRDHGDLHDRAGGAF